MRFLRVLLCAVALSAGVFIPALAAPSDATHGTIESQLPPGSAARALFDVMLDLLSTESARASGFAVSPLPLGQPLDYEVALSRLNQSRSLNDPSARVFRSHERLLQDIFSLASSSPDGPSPSDPPASGPAAAAAADSTGRGRMHPYHADPHQRRYVLADELSRTPRVEDPSFTATPAGVRALAAARLRVLADADPAALAAGTGTRALTAAFPELAAADVLMLARVSPVLPTPEEVRTYRAKGAARALDPSHPDHALLRAATDSVPLFADAGRLRGGRGAGQRAMVPLGTLSDEEKESILRFIVQGEPSSYACTQCKELVAALRDIISVISPPHAIKFIKPICKTAGIWLVPLISRSTCDPKVPGECQFFCEGMLESWGPSVVDLVAGLVLDPRKRCIQAKACPADDAPLPAVFPATTVTPAGPARQYGSSRLLHISDIHLDPFYEEGSRAQCKMPVCCRGVAPTDTRPAARFGDYQCDAPETLVKASLAEIPRRNVSHVFFTGDAPAHDLWMQTKESNLAVELTVSDWLAKAARAANAVRRTGGQVDPALAGVPQEQVPAARKRDAAATAIWKGLFDASSDASSENEGKDSDSNDDDDPVRLWPVLGNHAAGPVDQFGGPAKDHWLYGAVAKSWSRFLPPSAVTSLTWGGYYTAPIEPGLHVLALQTNYYDPMNLYLLHADHPDLAGQFGWMEHVLAQIEALGEKVIVIGHELPLTFRAGYWQDTYMRIVRRYHRTIVGHLHGHIHSDKYHIYSLPTAAEEAAAALRAGLTPQQRTDADAAALTKAARLALSPTATGAAMLSAAAAATGLGRAPTPVDPRTLTPVGVSLLPSAVAPLDASTNPSFRIITLDGTEKTLLDYEQYRADLPAANARGSVEFELAYTACEQYGLRSLSPSELLRLAVRTMGSEALFRSLAIAYTGGVPHERPKGETVSKEVLGCALATATKPEFEDCLEFVSPKLAA